MRINHNIAALNTYSRLSQATVAQGKSLEKLSSGQRINKAGDDAAGLAISEKMRAQVRGLNQASRNAQDGISMIQTAEGALGETHSILQRMRELAVQSSNSTNTDADRGEMQKEINQLSSEVNRIAGTTEFNKQTLMDGGQAAGTVKGVTFAVTKQATDCTGAVYVYNFSTCVVAGDAITLFNGTCSIMLCTGACALCTCNVTTNVRSIANAINNICTGFRAEAVGGTLTIRAVAGCLAWGTSGNCSSIIGFASGGTACYTMTKTDGTCSCSNVTSITFTSSGIKEGVKLQVGDCSIGLWDSTAGTYLTADAAANCLGVDCMIDLNCSDGTTICLKDFVCTLVNCTGSIATCSTLCKIGDDTLTITSCSGTAAYACNAVSLTSQAGSAAAGSNGIQLQIGANTAQTFNVSFADMTGTGVKVTSNTSTSITTSNGKVANFSACVNVDNNGSFTQFSLDISSADKATNAISAIDDAITLVSAERSKLGAYQNRLEHTIANLDTSSENLTAAESRIRDVDMAKEMMEFTKNNILNQAATAMLAQANQQPQGVLQLLR